MLYETGVATILGHLFEDVEIQVWANDTRRIGRTVIPWEIDDCTAENEEDIVVDRPIGYDPNEMALWARLVRDDEDLADFELPAPTVIGQYTLTWEMGDLEVGLAALEIYTEV